MTRLFLAAGVAALAIAMPASAKPGGGQGGDDKQNAQTSKARGGDRAQRVERAPRAQATQRVERSQRVSMPRMERRAERSQRFATVQRQERRVERRAERPQRIQAVQRQERRIERVRPQRIERVERRAVEQRQVRANRIDQVRNRVLERQQVRNLDRDNRLGRIADRQAVRNELRGNRIELARGRDALRNELRANRIERLDNGVFVRDVRNGPRLVRTEDFGDRARGWGVGGCPPGLLPKGCIPPGQAAKLLGTPLATAARFATFDSVPISARYLYPDTDDYFYRFGDGYAYRVDRDTSLLSALLPLAFGGYMPGSYFPSSYMSNAFVPDYYGFNSFYPTSYAGYGYGYDNLCNRYMNGVIYQVDCASGFVEDVIPLYAGGYGVGQMLPAGYGYYNVPYQYRSMYYDTPDYNYWYAPGAIYQYDPSSSLITSVAALLSPGFSIGQPLPMGYDVYNVPYGYRNTYFDSPNAMYRYNNGNIYQIDPTTMLVTAIVASILT